MVLCCQNRQSLDIEAANRSNPPEDNYMQSVQWCGHTCSKSTLYTGLVITSGIALVSFLTIGGFILSNNYEGRLHKLGTAMFSISLIIIVGSFVAISVRNLFSNCQPNH